MSEVGSENEAPRVPELKRRPRGVLGIFAVLALVGGAIVYYYWPRNPSPTAEVPLPDITVLGEDDEPDAPAIVRNPGYLGPQACAPCHARRVAEFLTTPHARACRRPQDGPMPEGFTPGNGRFTTLDRSLQFEMTRSGSEYFQTVVKTGSSKVSQTSRIDLVYGANKADEVFFTGKSGRLNELMAVWLHPSQRWAHTSYNPYGSSEFFRETTTRCIECHNTWIEHVPETTNEYKLETAVLGVTCERCHGPAREHVEFHKLHPAATLGQSVIHPGRLTRDRQIEVCTQCHGNATKARGPVFAYRPGQPLGAHFRTAITRHPDDDHVANQIEYLRQSKCFQKSETLTCVTCHDPHRPHDVANAAASRRACLQCHQRDGCTDRPNLPVAVRDECIGCHMPQRVWMNVHFHTEDERYVPPIRRYQHRIAVDRNARSEVLLGWLRNSPSNADKAMADQLMTELVGHWMAETDRFRREYRFLAAIGAAREALRLDPRTELRQKSQAALDTAIKTQSKLDGDLVDALQSANEQRYLAAIDTLKRVLTVKPDWADAHSRLGIFYARTGQRERSTPHLEAVARHDPDNGSGLIVLGELADRDSRFADAAEFYRRADEIDPFDANINYRWGLALLRQGRGAEAVVRFRRVLVIDSKHAGAYQGLSHALREQSRGADAVRAARRAASLTRFDHADVLVTLAEAYAAVSRAPEAAAAAVKALEIDATQPGGHQLSPDVRRRLEDLRARARQ